MRVVFMGTPSFAVPSLEALAECHDVVAVYSRPDSVSGRGSASHPSAVKQAALELGLSVRTPQTLRDSAEHEVLRELSPDVGVVAAYGLILPRQVLGVPPLGFLNVHASLLPRWRGAAPIQRAILAGDEYTGVSIMRMEEGLDTGPYCEISRTTVADKTADELIEELALLGAEALVRALGRLGAGGCDWTVQDEAAVTYADKVTKADIRLSPDLSATELLRRIRASSSQSPARIAIGGTALTVLDATDSALDLSRGAVRASRRDVFLAGSDGTIELLTVKPDGRKAMEAAAWARGATISADACWDSTQ